MLKKVYGFYALFTLFMLAGAAISIAFSLVFGKKDLFFNMIFSSEDRISGIILGVFLALTSGLSILAVVQRNHVTGPLVMLNWMLIADAVAVITVGSRIWFFSLRQRAEFHTKWIELSGAERITIQDMFSCCGYFLGNDTAEIGGKFCTSQDFANSLNATNTANFCVTPITQKTDYTLENTFTSIYAFMVPVIGLFLASLCVIQMRNEIERFKRIDLKRGGRGFV
ncbi:tetraspanin [Peniophora sp. CONT]|nr:tetraspanin [Peniophora sp. CONT]